MYDPVHAPLFAVCVIKEDGHGPFPVLSLSNSRLNPLVSSGNYWTGIGTRTLGWPCKGGLNSITTHIDVLFVGFIVPFFEYLDGLIARLVSLLTVLS